MKLFIGILLAAVHLQPYATADSSAAAGAAAASRGGSSSAAAAAAAASDSSVLPAPSFSCNCPLIYNPVCGSDGRTYSNDCVLKCISAERVKNGRSPIYVARLGECPQEVCVCPAIYQPVCGTDGYTYSNECALGCENRRRAKLGLPPIRVASKGKCPPPPCICSGAVIPVCGTDGVTYRNICFLQCASRRNQEAGLPPIFFKSNGACPKENCICTLEIRPVCASDGKTYSNRCLLNCENRRRNALGLYPLTIKNDGPCYTCPCSNTDDPVCASDDRTYKNPCFLKCENDARARIGLPPLQTRYKGICGCACKKYFDPVCGTDDQTYDNICLLHCESNRREFYGLGPIYLAYGGPCVCNCRNCNFNFVPVCGSDGRTYWNRCWLDCYSACNVRKGLPKITQVKPGYC